MIISTSAKKIKVSHFSVVSYILTKGMITFSCWMTVRMMMITEEKPKIYERIFDL